MNKVKIILFSIGAILVVSGCTSTCETNPALQSTSERILCGHKDAKVLGNLRAKLNELDQRSTKIQQQIEEYNVTLFMVAKKRDSLELKEDELEQLNREVALLKQSTKDLEMLNTQTQAQIDAKKKLAEDSSLTQEALKSEVSQLEGDIEVVESQVDSVNNAFKRSLAMSLLSDK